MAINDEGTPVYPGAADLMDDAVTRGFITFVDVDDPLLPDSDPRDVILVTRYVEDGAVVFFYKTVLKSEYIEFLLAIIKCSMNRKEITFAAERISDCLFALEENREYTSGELQDRMLRLIETARKRITGESDARFESIRRIKFIDELLD